MGVDYVALAKTAKKLISENGQTVTFQTQARGTYNPSAGFSSSSNSTYTAEVVMLNTGKAEKGDGTQQGEEQPAICSSTTELKISDTATINGRKYRVTSVTKVQPATTVLYYDVLLAS